MPVPVPLQSGLLPHPLGGRGGGRLVGGWHYVGDVGRGRGPVAQVGQGGEGRRLLLEFGLLPTLLFDADQESAELAVVGREFQRLHQVG